MSTKELLMIFLPALLLGSFALFVSISNYEPQFPEIDPEETAIDFQIPILPNDPIVGDRRAATTLIAFEDFACEGCRIATGHLKQLLRDYPGQFKIIWKGLPVTRFPFDSRNAVKLAYCADQEGRFEEYEALAFANFDDLSDPVLDSIWTTLDLPEANKRNCLNDVRTEQYVTRNEQIARQLNIQSVPTFFLDNQQVTVPGTVEGWRQILNL